MSVSVLLPIKLTQLTLNVHAKNLVLPVQVQEQLSPANLVLDQTPEMYLISANVKSDILTVIPFQIANNVTANVLHVLQVLLHALAALVRTETCHKDVNASRDSLRFKEKQIVTMEVLLL